MKVIFHMDIDSYFVSASRTVDPRLKDKVVVISMGKKRSIVMAASYEAKRLGIKVPMPMHQAKRIYPKVISVKPNFPLYTHLSSKIFEHVAANYSDLLEVASIDECYIDVTKQWSKYGSPYKMAKVIQEDILKTFDIPISFGISETKFVAKMSTQINKPYGITVTAPGKFLDTFADWDVEEIHGVGAPSAYKLKMNGIETIKDFHESSFDLIKNILGKAGESLWFNIQEKGTSEINLDMNELKGIGSSMTFQDRDRETYEDMEIVLRHLTTLVAQRAVNRSAVGYVVAVGLKSAERGKTPQRSMQRKLKVPVGTFQEIFPVVMDIFEEFWNGSSMKFAGVYLSDLHGKYDITYQSTIFNINDEISKEKQLVNKINGKFNSKVVVLGDELQATLKKEKHQSRYLESDRIVKHYDK